MSPGKGIGRDTASSPVSCHEARKKKNATTLQNETFPRKSFQMSLMSSLALSPGLSYTYQEESDGHPFLNK